MSADQMGFFVLGTIVGVLITIFIIFNTGGDTDE
jgi:hypothetical protein